MRMRRQWRSGRYRISVDTRSRMSGATSGIHLPHIASLMRATQSAKPERVARWRPALFHLQPELMDELAPLLFFSIDVVGVFGRRRAEGIAAFETNAFLHLRIVAEFAQLGAEDVDDLRWRAVRRK